MSELFVLPDLGEGLTEAEILEWRVEDGDSVAVDQIVVVVETAKATVEVPVPFAGTVSERLARTGEVIGVGRPLLSVDPPADGPVRGTVAGVGTSLRSDAAADGEPVVASDGESGNVLVGYGTSRPAGTRRRRPRLGASRSGPSAPSVTSPDPAPRVISPLVRRRAAEHGIDVAAVPPTGRGGVVLRRDVDAAISGRSEERIPLAGVRGATAAKMVRSHTEIPAVTTWVDADATDLLAARDALRAAGRDVSTLALLGRICVVGLGRYPDLNASVDAERQSIVRHRGVSLGVAVQTDRGVFVPVIHDADRLTVLELTAAMVRLAGAAREGSLAPADAAGGTITLNNYGVFGVDGSTPIINHPEAALVGVGRMAEKPWVHDGALAVRKVVQLSLTFDHRVCDGAVAGGFLRFVADAVEHPLLLLADL